MAPWHRPRPKENWPVDPGSDPGSTVPGRWCGLWMTWTRCGNSSDPVRTTAFLPLACRAEEARNDDARAAVCDQPVRARPVRGRRASCRQRLERCRAVPRRRCRGASRVSLSVRSSTCSQSASWLPSLTGSSLRAIAQWQSAGGGLDGDRGAERRVVAGVKALALKRCPRAGDRRQGSARMLRAQPYVQPPTAIRDRHGLSPSAGPSLRSAGSDRRTRAGLRTKPGESLWLRASPGRDPGEDPDKVAKLSLRVIRGQARRSGPAVSRYAWTCRDVGLRHRLRHPRLRHRDP